MNSADMREVWKRLAERRRGTYGELADLVNALGREHYVSTRRHIIWPPPSDMRVGKFASIDLDRDIDEPAMQGCRE